VDGCLGGGAVGDAGCGGRGVRGTGEVVGREGEEGRWREWLCIKRMTDVSDLGTARGVVCFITFRECGDWVLRSIDGGASRIRCAYFLENGR
jgi:hypothetical protein